MTAPFAEAPPPLAVRAEEPEQFLRIEPDGLKSDRWLRGFDAVDRSLPADEFVDRYVLPESEEHAVEVVTVPAGTALRIGDVAGRSGRSGGGELAELLEHEEIPEAWIEARTTLAGFLD